ncbi:hypothetical protein HAX54_045977 [Datura stramonium]|uniref:Transmembrane protein n=1 Tax=Datura stramonium TaxID=4076 RepID=A0ABS8RQ35_DATST|nr:hypothetical protein [Datura stramonium]
MGKAQHVVFGVVVTGVMVVAIIVMMEMVGVVVGHMMVAVGSDGCDGGCVDGSGRRICGDIVGVAKC